MTQTLLITGASSGFGAACARRFAEAGDRLVLLVRNRERLQPVLQSLPKHCPVHVVCADMRDREAIAALPLSLPEAFRAIDVLVNNVGLALGCEPAYEAELEDWEVMVDTNIKGLMRLTRAILPGMVERDRGHIINIGSTAASWPYPGGNAYGGSKAFVQQFSRGLKADLAGTRLRVSCIEPGMAETEFSVARFKGDREAADQVYAGTEPMRAEDIAEAIHWCTRMPAHVNVNAIELMPVCQTWAGWKVSRDQS